MGIIGFAIWILVRLATIALKFWYLSLPFLILIVLAIWIQHRKLHPKSKKSD